MPNTFYLVEKYTHKLDTKYIYKTGNKNTHTRSNRTVIVLFPTMYFRVVARRSEDFVPSSGGQQER